MGWEKVQGDGMEYGLMGWEKVAQDGIRFNGME